MTRVSVKPEVIEWARKRVGRTADSFTGTFPKFLDWEEGTVAPTLRQLEDFAKQTSTPLGYLFLTEPPDVTLPIPDFRTLKDKKPIAPSPNLLDTVQMLQRRQDWIRNYMLDDGSSELSFVGSADIKGSPSEIAQEMRDIVGVSANWAAAQENWNGAFKALRSAIEYAGVYVVINGIVGNNTSRPLSVDEFRGFALVDTYAPFVFVNGADAKSAQMFTLVHELSHIWLGVEGVSNLKDTLPVNSDIELFCNKIAAEFLIPTAELQIQWKAAAMDIEPFKVLAKIFKVSPIVAARRAADLGLITRNSFFDFYNAHMGAEFKKAKTTGGNFYATQDYRVGRRFSGAVFRAAREGRLLYRDAYSLTGLYGATFDAYMKKLGYLP